MAYKTILFVLVVLAAIFVMSDAVCAPDGVSIYLMKLHICMGSSYLLQYSDQSRLSNYFLRIWVNI